AGGIPMATKKRGGRAAPARGLAAPCQVVSAGVALRENLHAWQSTAAPGWFVCSGCGIIGVCTACFADVGDTPPLTRHGMRCPRHHTHTGPRALRSDLQSDEEPEAGGDA